MNFFSISLSGPKTPDIPVSLKKDSVVTQKKSVQRGKKKKESCSWANFEPVKNFLVLKHVQFFFV